MDGRAVADVVAMAGLLREALAEPGAAGPARLEHGWLAGHPRRRDRRRRGPWWRSAPPPRAACAADSRPGSFSFSADRPALETLLESGELTPAVAALPAPLLLMHAQGDERVAGRALARARRGVSRPRQPPDRGSRRPPSLSPARRGAPGGQPALASEGSGAALEARRVRLAAEEVSNRAAALGNGVAGLAGNRGHRAACAPAHHASNR